MLVAGLLDLLREWMEGGPKGETKTFPSGVVFLHRRPMTTRNLARLY